MDKRKKINTSNPNVSVIIPAFNEEKNIVLCLDSLSKQVTDFSFEVILVDNNSSDKTVENALKFKDKLNLRIISEKRQGRGPARFKGFQEAKGEILFSADADSIYPPDWLNSYIRKLKSTNAVAVTGSCKIEDCTDVTNFLVNMLQPGVMVLYKGFLGHYWLSGFNFVIKKSAYKEVGGFNTNLNAQEDLELSYRVAKVGNIVFLNKPVLASGRRFKKGVAHGFFQYFKTFVETIVLKQESAYLTNQR